MPAAEEEKLGSARAREEDGHAEADPQVGCGLLGGERRAGRPVPVILEIPGGVATRQGDVEADSSWWIAWGLPDRAFGSRSDITRNSSRDREWTEDQEAQPLIEVDIAGNEPLT